MEIRKYFELNENTKYQNLQTAVEVMPRGKFIALHVYIKNNNVNTHLKKLE